MLGTIYPNNRHVKEKFGSNSKSCETETSLNLLDVANID
jgi:hypothetical protein